MQIRVLYCNTWRWCDLSSDTDMRLILHVLWLYWTASAALGVQFGERGDWTRTWQRTHFALHWIILKLIHGPPSIRRGGWERGRHERGEAKKGERVRECEIGCARSMVCRTFAFLQCLLVFACVSVLLTCWKRVKFCADAECCNINHINCSLTASKKELQKSSELARPALSSPKRLAVVSPKPQSPGKKKAFKMCFCYPACLIESFFNLHKGPELQRETEALIIPVY